MWGSESIGKVWLNISFRNRTKKALKNVLNQSYSLTVSSDMFDMLEVEGSGDRELSFDPLSGFEPSYIHRMICEREGY